MCVCVSWLTDALLSRDLTHPVVWVSLSWFVCVCVWRITCMCTIEHIYICEHIHLWKVLEAKFYACVCVMDYVWVCVCLLVQSLRVCLWWYVCVCVFACLYCSHLYVCVLSYSECVTHTPSCHALSVPLTRYLTLRCHTLSVSLAVTLSVCPLLSRSECGLHTIPHTQLRSLTFSCHTLSVYPSVTLWVCPLLSRSECAPHTIPRTQMPHWECVPFCHTLSVAPAITLWVCPSNDPSHSDVTLWEYPFLLSHFECVSHTVPQGKHLTMGWLRLVGSLKLQVSFAEYSLFYRALLQKRPIISRSLLIIATPHPSRETSLFPLYCLSPCVSCAVSFRFCTYTRTLYCLTPFL